MLSEVLAYYYGKHRQRREMDPVEWRAMSRHEAALGRLIGLLLIALLVIALFAGIFGHQQ